MLKLQPSPTFKAKVSIHVPGEPDAVTTWVFRYMTAKELAEFSTGDAAKGRSDLDTVMAIAAGWEDIDAPFTRENVEALFDRYHSAGRSVVDRWLSELTGARLGN